MSRLRWVQLASLFVLSLLLISQTHASLLERDDAVFGTGSVTLDTETGLEWLDMSFGLSMTRSYVSTQFGDGGEFEGFRYATKAEVIELLVNADIELGYWRSGDPSDWPLDEIEYLVSFLGATDYFKGYPRMYGVTGSGEVAGVYFFGGTVKCRTGDQGLVQSAGIVNNNWIVRECSTVPIPGAVWLLGSGLVGLAGLRRRRRTTVG